MDIKIRAVILECAEASLGGRLSFGDVVMRLMAVGIERYHADYVRGETCYYLPSGECEIVPLPLHGEIAQDFSAADVQAAIKGAQSGALAYPAFSARVMAAGCVGYMVSIIGKRVIYYGRSGDMHVEWFPGAK